MLISQEGLMKVRPIISCYLRTGTKLKKNGEKRGGWGAGESGDRGVTQGGETA